MLAKPFLEDRLAEGAGFEVMVDEGDDFGLIGFEPRAVQPEENVHAGKGDALVAIDEAMVHRKAFPQGGCLFDQVGIVTGLRAQQRRFDQAVIANAGCATEQAQLLGVDEERVFKGEVFHLLGQRLVDACPAFRALGVQALDRRIDLAARGLGHATEFLWRHDDGDIAPLPLHAHWLGLCHVDELAETVLSVGGGEGFHQRILAELANLGNGAKMKGAGLLQLGITTSCPSLHLADEEVEIRFKVVKALR